MICFAESEGMSDENVDVGRNYSRVLYRCNYSRLEEKAMNRSPCKGCLKRSAHPNCHITCDLYAEFVHYRQTLNDAKRKKDVLCEYITKRRERHERAKRR